MFICKTYAIEMTQLKSPTETRFGNSVLWLADDFRLDNPLGNFGIRNILKITCIYWFIIMMSAKKPQDNLDIRITECCFRHKQKFFWFTKTISDQLNEKSNFGPNKAYSESQNIHVKKLI